MDKDQVINIIQNNSNKRDSWFDKHHPTVFLFFKEISSRSWKENAFRWINDIIENPRCQTCGIEVEFINFTKGYRQYCSTKCLSNSKLIKEKRERTNIEKYGGSNPMHSKEIRDKLSESMIVKYGVDNISKLDITKQKVRKTNLEKHGFEYPSQNPINKEIISNSMKSRSLDISKSTKDRFSKYVENKLSKIGLKLISTDKSVYQIQGQCNHIFEIHKNTLNDRIRNINTICSVCNPIDLHQSNQEELLYEWVRSLTDYDIIRNDRKLIGQELDIYIPELNLAFEYNGIYWHSDKYKDRMYHVEKYKKCNDIGIKVIQVWEDLWINKKDIIKSRIKNLLGKSQLIWARKCDIREVSISDTRIFIDENHIQGYVYSKVNYGLYYNNDLVSVMTFGGLRKSLGQRSKDGSWELLRYCTKMGINVVGGPSRLLKKFIINNNPESIVSYASKDWSIGSLYESIGFKYLHDTEPNYFWFKNNVRYNRFKFTKMNLVKMGFSSDESESEIMKSQGYMRIYDSGSKKYIMQF